MPLHPHHKIARQPQQTPEIIVDQPDIDALRGLADQDLFDAAPHFPFADDEKLQKDELFRAFQIGQQLRIHCLAAGEIFGGGVLPCRIGAVIGEIAAQAPAARIQRLGLFLRLHKVSGVFFFHLLHPLAHPLGRCLVAEQQIQCAAQQRQQTDQYDPDDLVGTVLVFAHQIEHDDDAEQLQTGVDPDAARGQREKRPQQPRHLQRHQNDRDDRTVEDLIEESDDRQTKKHSFPPCKTSLRQTFVSMERSITQSARFCKGFTVPKPKRPRTGRLHRCGVCGS